MKNFTYTPSGTCSRSIDITIADDGTIAGITFTGGCNGNLKGIAALVTGQRPEDVIPRLKGLRCGGKETSCPDQLARALEAIC